MKNNSMYAIERSDNYLAHYGIKGMKWGVQRALNRGDNKALARQYKKAAKKLAKLEVRANTNKQLAKAKKWDQISSNARAVGRVGLGTVAATTAFSGAPNSPFGTISPWGYSKAANRIIKDVKAMRNDIDLNTHPDQRVHAHKMVDATKEARFKKLDKLDTMSQGIQKAGIAAAAGGYATSAAAKLRANYLRNRATGAGHDKAVAKANEFRNEMNKAFAGTKYAGKPKKRRRR